MPTTYTGRIILILVVFFGAMLCITSPGALFDSNLTLRQKLNLKPGIDMVGGTRLIYKIRPPEGGMRVDYNGRSEAEQMIDPLKKRIDPDGVRNLIWRPIGTDEIEIQMPEAPDSAQTPAKRKAYMDAQAALNATNVHQSAVLNAIKMPAGNERDQAMVNLAMGDPARLTLFTSLAAMSDQLVAARATAGMTEQGTPATLPANVLPTTQQAMVMAQQIAGALNPTSAPSGDQQTVRAAVKVLDEVGEKYDEQVKHIEDDNINPADVESIVDQNKVDATKATARLNDLKTRYANFPSRAKALDDYVAAYRDFSSIRGSLDDAQTLKAQLKGSGVLEFHILAFDLSDPKYLEMMQRMQPGGKGPSPQPGDTTYRWVEVDKPDEFDRPGSPARTTEWNDKHYLLALITPDASMTKATVIPGSDDPWKLESAHPSSTELGERCVGFEFNTPGATLFGNLTTRWQPDKTANRSYELAIVLDGKIVSAPNINQPITTGSGVITAGKGGYSDTDLQYLINTLNAGSAPAQLEDEPISEQRIGSTLGIDNVHKGLMACVFGLIVVAVFLIGYYYLAGLVAFIAVLFNLLIILGVMSFWGATFTLPSIAGIVLTIGTAVDANVLVFERLREELHSGLGLKMALRNSYDRAFSAIIDSNMTSLITSFFLFIFGSEEVKGFGLTLIIGIIASLFTALYVTKTVFGLLIDYGGIKTLGSIPTTFPRWDRLLKPNIDWMGLAWMFYSFSAVAITAGLVLFVVYTRRNQMMDIEFAAGTKVEFELKESTPIDEVRRLISLQKDAIPSPSVNSVGAEDVAGQARVYEVATPKSNASTVREAVVQALGTRLRTQLPSKFDGLAVADVSQAVSQKIMFPIPADLKQWPMGSAPRQAGDFPGGVAIVMNNIDPPMTPAEIRSRIDTIRPQTPGAQGLSSVEVVAPGADEAPTASALVLASSPSIFYSKEHLADWQDQLAAPAWDMVRSAINHQADLRKVNSFNPSIASDLRTDAMIALTLSILVIMAYIWVRFGNLTYGTATVVALLHDTVFTLAALGFAHLLADSAIGNWLQLEPFSINLTVVAGILTIMGYSMIDTIVVFDRIRENRGKFGHLSREVVNSAINQTLSRTLLTAGTTTITVAFMYFLGGSGIHGFTFVLLIGILVGTYSSVAIAAPILLLHSEAERRPPQPSKRPPGELRAASAVE